MGNGNGMGGTNTTYMDTIGAVNYGGADRRRLGRTGPPINGNELKLLIKKGDEEFKKKCKKYKKIVETNKLAEGKKKQDAKKKYQEIDAEKLNGNYLK
ncbi:MAG: hypothetical protein ABIH83_05610 [Candidatus Micrarchaeota archaeon]